VATRNYERLTVEDFGRHLITTGDLDPVYCALHDWEPDEDYLAAWLVSYWCFYHCGAASYLAEKILDFGPTGYWQEMLTAAINEKPAPNGGRWPRGSERRHFRGKQGVAAIHDLQKRYPQGPLEMIDALREAAPSFKSVTDRASSHRGFGPWISFKIADMVDRVLGVYVEFETDDVFMFKDPVKGAEMVWRKHFNLPDTAKPKNQAHVIQEAVAHLEREFSDLKAPPDRQRRIALQEVETVLCKWKSHMNGHYPLFNDIHEIREGCVGWGDAAEEFLKYMPQGSDA